MPKLIFWVILRYYGKLGDKLDDALNGWFNIFN